MSISSKTAENGNLTSAVKLRHHFLNVALLQGFENFRAQASTSLDYFWKTLVVNVPNVTAVCIRVMVCRAIHIEVVYLLAASSFIQACFRLIHRREPVQTTVYQLLTVYTNYGQRPYTNFPLVE